ncbi:MAG: alpha-amylase [Rickettsiales bacterium TMED289]|nr:MAG: alpha-amylase [Rickettsiales bacterium TMED289]|tara:strand:- start:88 stop:1803 length:1716 start_codon:yes stop_codon:yes gene_type:complete
MLSKKDRKNLEIKFNNIYLNSKISNKLYTDEIINLINKFNKKNKVRNNLKISEKTSLVISYGNSVTDGNRKSLKVFYAFYKKYLKKSFDTIHFLPFYPSSSDSGFAVKDHYKIDPRLGTWSDVRRISQISNVMGDLVINHSSARGLWFSNFLKNKSPGKGYFFAVDKNFKSTNVIRPREHRLLKKINLMDKEKYLWRTFSPDQIDLNFKNPKVLMRFIKIILNLINHGIRIFRLDAIAYLWKESGTKCINHYNTHNIIKLIRTICSLLSKECIIITETNLPEKENLSYFGKNDEANWVYNFSLSPLLVYSLLFEDSKKITKWSKNFPSTKKNNNYLNFIASHDGIGMRPIEGILDNNTKKKFFQRLKKNGGEFSFRKILGKGKNVYEANITLFNAFKKSNIDKNGKFGFERYFAAHSIMMSFEGVPAIYFNSIFGNSNDNSKYIISGNKRDLNRYRWNSLKLENHLKDKKSKQNKYYVNMINLLKIRNKQKAFHPNAQRITLDLGSRIFAFKRTSLDKKQTITCITNMTSNVQLLNVNGKIISGKNLLNEKLVDINKKLQLQPFQTVWISN